MKRIIGNLIMLTGFLGGIYVGGWVMFLKPIIEACRAFDAGMLTGSMIGITILKCLFAGTVGLFIYYAGVIIGYLFYE